MIVKIKLILFFFKLKNFNFNFCIFFSLIKKGNINLNESNYINENDSKTFT